MANLIPELAFGVVCEDSFLQSQLENRVYSVVFTHLKYFYLK